MFRININHSTKGLNIGRPEAEAEDILSVFEDYQNIDNNIKNGSFIISGRKGAGKSAYARWLIEKAKTDEHKFCSLIKKDDLNLEQTLQSISNDSLKFSALFEWIILVKIVKMIIDSPIGQYSLPEYKALKTFYTKNSGLVQIDQYVIAEVLTNKEVNYSPFKNLTLWNRFSHKSIKAPFYAMIQPLRDTVSDILKKDVFKDCQFYVLFDDLDVKFKLTRESDKQMLMGLIRVTKNYNTDYFKDCPVKVLVFLRDDIGQKLNGVDCDTTKIFGSYEYRINWYEHLAAREDETNTMLRKFINKRLAISFKNKGINFDASDPWLTFSEEYSSADCNKTMFKYILDYTFYLPRDLITIFKDISSKNFRLPLTCDKMNLLLREFAKRKKQEIVDELVASYNKEEIDKLFLVLEKLNKDDDKSFDNVMSLLEEESFEMSDFQNLLDYNLLIPIDVNDHLYYSYREQSITSGYENYCYSLPKVLVTYFHL